MDDTQSKQYQKNNYTQAGKEHGESLCLPPGKEHGESLSPSPFFLSFALSLSLSLSLSFSLSLSLSFLYRNKNRLQHFLSTLSSENSQYQIFSNSYH